jgi:hypothetical protein
MLENITWPQFLFFLCILLVIYYAGLFLFTFRKSANTQQGGGNEPRERKRIWNVSPATETAAGAAPSPAKPVNTTDTDEEQLFESLEALAAAITTIIDQTTNKTELLQKISGEIGRYPLLKGEAFQLAIVNLVIREAALKQQIDITREEALALWQQLQ